MAGENRKYSIVDKLAEKDIELKGREEALTGMTALTLAPYVNAMRGTMFTSHLKQFQTLPNSESPYMFTGAENVVGEHSSGLERIEHQSKVICKVVKFEDIIENPTIFTMFLYDQETDTYFLKTREETEDLSEDFGWDWNNELIDSLEDGDVLEAGAPIRKSTSYDEECNYGYGLNTLVQYTLDPPTSEDAGKCSIEFAKRAYSIGSKHIRIGANQNDFAINLYGKNGDYKPFPEIGEKTTKYVASLRRLFKNQLLFDFNDNNIGIITDADETYYTVAGSTILDYSIYVNNEEFDHDSMFNKQISKYIKSQNKYWKKIKEVCLKIFETGSNFTNDVDYIYKRSLEMLDTKKKWKERDTPFGNLIIDLTVKQEKPITVGDKVVARFGNKSVISRVVPQEEMSQLDDGRYVELELSLLGIINRTTSAPLYEIFINCCSRRIREKLATMDNLKDMEVLLFGYIDVLWHPQYIHFKSEYDKLDDVGKHNFMNDIIKIGIPINQIAFKEEGEYLWYKIIKILDKWGDIIQPYTVYIKKWGRRIKTLNKHFIAEMYIMKLKQSGFRGYSARSTGAIDTKDLPVRSYKSKVNKEEASSTSIRFGEFESLTFGIGTPPEDIALFYKFYRTSKKARKALLKLGLSDSYDENNMELIDDEYTSISSEMFSVLFQGLGEEVQFVNDDQILDQHDNSTVREYRHPVTGEFINCTPYEYFILKRKQELREEIQQKQPLILESELERMVTNLMAESRFVVGPVFEDGKEVIH